MRTLEATLALAKSDCANLPDTGIPNRYWPFTYGNYCCATVTHWLDDFGGHPLYDLPNISIAALRADRKWPEGSKPKPGALVLMNFSGTSEAEHIGLCRGTQGSEVLTYEGNTGPAPGDPSPNGFYERVRDPQNVVGYIYPPYAKVVPPEEAFMKAPLNTDFKKDQAFTAGVWKTIELSKPGTFSFLTAHGPTNVIARASFNFEGLLPGDVAQVRFTKVVVSPTGKVTHSVGLPLVEIHGSAGGAFGQVFDIFALGSGERVRIQVLSTAGSKLVKGNVSWVIG